MSARDDEINLRPGRIKHGNQGAKRPKSFVGQVMRAARKAGHTGKASDTGAGQKAVHVWARPMGSAVPCIPIAGRRVVIKARVVRHQGRRFRSAPLSKHVAYLKREGVTRDGADAQMFDATSESADDQSFCRAVRGGSASFPFHRLA